jgi:uncharacterized protein YbjT (DUF2867 family)
MKDAFTVDRSPPASVWLAGASGLVGRALLDRLLADPRTDQVHLLLRRAVRNLPSDPRVVTHEVDFDRLDSLPPADEVFIALGTTIQQAGSQEAFRRVDFDAVVTTARAGRAAGARRLGVVSALGAHAASTVFYNRVKGEMQAAIIALGYPTVVFAQPSLLLGDRERLGQPTRRLEAWAMRWSRPVMGLLPRRVRPITAVDVAAALLRELRQAPPGVHLLSSGAMQGAAQA